MTISAKIEIAHPAKTPQAAAAAGIAFAVLFALGVTFVRLGAAELSSGEGLSGTTQNRLTWAMTLMPFAQISSRLGGAVMLILATLLISLLA